MVVVVLWGGENLVIENFVVVVVVRDECALTEGVECECGAMVMVGHLGDGGTEGE